MRKSTKAINILLAIAVVIVSVYLVFQTQSVNPASSANSEIEVPNTVAVGKGTVRQTVIAPGQIEFVDTTLLVPKVGGQIAAVRVRPGDFVRQGDILAQLDGGPFEAALKAAQAARQRAEANHDREIFRAELALRMARLRLQMATEKDQDQNAEAGLDIQLLELGVEDAQAYLDGLIESGIDPGILSAIERAEADLEAATVKAPFDALVLEVQVKSGETIGAGSGLFVLADPSDMEVTSTVIEEDLPLVQIGQKVELFLDAFPESIFQGRVTNISPQRLPFQDRPLYQVSIRLDELPSDLASGMTVDATIVIHERQDVLRLPRALVRAGTSETTTVETWVDGAVQEREILLGMRGDVYIEILEGLQEGEQVVGQ